MADEFDYGYICSMVILEMPAAVCEYSCFSVHAAMQVLVAVFLGIVFIQSGLDKMDDREGNLSWMKDHFARSPFKNRVPLLLVMLTVMELASGILNLSAAVTVFFTPCTRLFLWGSISASVTFLCLFLGQRLAKDYAGAQGLTGYFIISLIAIWLCS